MTALDDLLRHRIEDLERQLQEANETLDAIRNGEVDAVVVRGPDGQIVYTLENADRPYRVLVEQMIEGAVTLSGEGLLLYVNRSFSNLLERRFEELVGASLFDHVDDPRLLRSMLRNLGGSAEMALLTRSGRPVPVNVSIVELHVEGGAQHVLCGIITDLSQNYARACELA